MTIAEDIAAGKSTIAVVGLGYVGMSRALSFAAYGLSVIGFDVNKHHIEQYSAGIDPTNKVGSEALRTTTVNFTSNEARLNEGMAA